MASIKDQYNDHVTSKSKQELIIFAKWFKKKHKSWPTVIGGWAVWSYYPDGFGSRDVDLILPSDTWIDEIMKKEYFPSHGFSPYEYLNQFWVDKHYGKPIDPAKPDDDVVFFDLLSASRTRDDPEELGVYVNWKWANDFGREVKIGDAIIVVPEVELLIPLKIIGALARIRSLHIAKDRTYLTGKIWKDYCDIASLASYVKIDKQKLMKHFTNTKLTKILVLEFLDGYISRPDVLTETKTKMSVIEDILVDRKKKPAK